MDSALAITRDSYVFNAREFCVSHDTSARSGMYAHDKWHPMILVSWIEAFIFIRGVIIQMEPMKMM